MGRIVLLVTSPRLPAGLLTAPAWDVLRTNSVFADRDTESIAALRAAGVSVTLTGGSGHLPASGHPSASGPVVDALLDAVARHGTVVWFAGSGADETLARELGLRLAREPALAELELMYGSWDPAGARLLDAVAVMDRLVSPGGDPWKRQQTHQTLGRYLLEEAYETYDAIEAHDLAALREELGDVLLQVVLHARMAEEADEPWSIDDVAGGLVDKLVRRNPHVFGSANITDVDEIVDNWERIKREEGAARGSDGSEAGVSVLDGVARAQPALSLAAKIVSRARRSGIDVPVPSAAHAPADEASLGATLLALVAEAEERGLDPEAALRRAALAYFEAVRAAEM
jgi:XTP/dITP diphosphohydrolase